MTDNTWPTLRAKARVQGRVIWALTMREVITRFGREGLGAFWLVAEPAMFVAGVTIIFPYLDSSSTYSVAEYLAISYPTLLFWRNGTNRVTKSLEINRALLHHRPITPLDIIFSRILLEFSGATGALLLIYLALMGLGVCHLPANPLKLILGLLLVQWFSFAFVLIMSALSELSDTIERLSHLILYLMLPFSGIFIPLYTLPEKARTLLLYFPLIDAIELYHAGYYGKRMPTYYNTSWAIFSLLFLTLFGMALTKISIRKVQLLQ